MVNIKLNSSSITQAKTILSHNIITFQGVNTNPPLLKLQPHIDTETKN